MKVIARLLYRLKRSGIPVRLAAWHCGTAENFNPLDGAVTLTADAPQEQVNALLEAEFAVLDKGDRGRALRRTDAHRDRRPRAEGTLCRGQRGAGDAAVADAEQPLSRDRERGADDQQRRASVAGERRVPCRRVLPFVLASFGTSMSISGLKSEGKAVLTAVLAVACIVGLGVIAGFTFMDLRTAIYGPIEVAGGGQAGLVFLTALREKSGIESPARALDYVLALCRSFGFRTKNANYRCATPRSARGGAAASARNLPRRPFWTYAVSEE